MLTLKLILQILSAEERLKMLKLFLLMLVMALLDVVGVASIMPFMAVLGSPEIIETNTTFAYFYGLTTSVGVTSKTQFLFCLGIINLCLLFVSLAFKAFVVYAQMGFVYMQEASISARLVEGYLNQPYSWFIEKNSSDIGKTVLSEVQSVIIGSLLPMVVLVAHSAVAFALLVLLVIVDPIVALATAMTLAIIYAAIYRTFSHYLRRSGVSRVEANRARFESVGEAFGAIKDIKIASLEDVYARRFSRPAVEYASNLTFSQLISQLPKYAVEGLAFGGVMALILTMMVGGEELGEILPVVGVYVFAGYRLIPALQNIYISLTQLKFSGPALTNLCVELNDLDALDNSRRQLNIMSFKKVVEMRNISFTYKRAKRPVINKLSIDVRARTTVALVGPTGCGKTTVIDIMLGLLEPDSGGVFVDGTLLDDTNRKSWRRSIGYVPQQIFLADASIAENIAFGVSPTNIDHAAMERAAKIANLHSFIVTSMADGYETNVGEKGVKLSGGQRQRIGIARALYHSPEVLIFDEATSALDGYTEKAVMEAVNNLGKKITIIIIAHRLKTVRSCDEIFFFSEQGLSDRGTYESLKANNKSFRALAKLA